MANKNKLKMTSYLEKKSHKPRNAHSNHDAVTKVKQLEAKFWLFFLYRMDLFCHLGNFRVLLCRIYIGIQT